MKNIKCNPWVVVAKMGENQIQFVDLSQTPTEVVNGTLLSLQVREVSHKKNNSADARKLLARKYGVKLSAGDLKSFVENMIEVGILVKTNSK